MGDRPEGLLRFRDPLVLGVCVAASLFLLTRADDTRVRWGTRWAHALTTPVEAVVGRIESLVGLSRENAELRARLAALELDTEQILAEREGIEALRERAGFFERSRGRLMPARVIELVVSRFVEQAKIQSLGDDSLAVFQPVVTERGLAGRVREILGPDLGLVELLTDLDSRISVVAVETGVVGLLRYDGRRFVMDHVPRGEPVEVGAVLHTSGLGGTVPRGLPVGRVSELRSSPSELFQHVTVEPFVHFSGLDEVYVVTRPGPWYARANDLTGFQATEPDTANGGARR